MKPQTQTITLDDLMAYVDGQLPADRCALVDAIIATDANAAEHLAEMRAQRQALHSHYDPVLNEPVPMRLLASRRPADTLWLKIASIAVWISIGLGIGSTGTWQYLSDVQSTPAKLVFDRGDMEVPQFVHQAKVAHVAYVPEVRHPVEIYSAQEQQLVTWLSKRLGRHLKAPNLSNAGFQLVGGRLLPGETKKPAAQFMYENTSGQRLTLYLRGMAKPTPETAFQFAEQDGIATFFWVDQDWGYALSGDLPRTELLEVATTIYQQLNG